MTERYPDDMGWLTAEAKAKRAPADPAGLDAAIEASVVAYDSALNDSLRNPLGSVMGEHGRAQLRDTEPWRAAITSAVRAAAPHIRRAVLLEAAEAYVARCGQTPWTPFDVDEWLRERAEREKTGG